MTMGGLLGEIARTQSCAMSNSKHEEFYFFFAVLGQCVTVRARLG